MNIEDCYFIRLKKVEEERFSELENILKDVKGVEVQYSFPYLGTVAAKIEDKNFVEELVQKGYIVESQNKLIALSEAGDLKLDAEKP